MKVTNMKELLKYVESKKIERKHNHIEILKVYGECKGMGNRRYKVEGKKSYTKGKQFAYNNRWNDYYRLNTNKIG
tara:strand:- start:707 stop:931 length:225 start_codon:yes stop_codon:yes gene_type:complete